MRFGNIAAFNWLWMAAAFAVFLWWAGRRRRRLLERFADTAVLPVLTAGVNTSRTRWKLFLQTSTVFLLALALVRPQWGFQWQTVTRTGVDIMIAVDVSRSMLATDIKPNRLERTKLAIRDLVEKLEGDRIGLIAFAGTAFVQCPLTVDYSGFLISLDDLSTGSIPRGGTSVSGAIREAMSAFAGGQKKYQALVIVTDGEDHEGDAAILAEQAKNAGIRVYCVGIGTPEGELIPLEGENGARTWLKDRSGNVVKSRLNETLLQEIALKTGGSYVRASSLEFGLDLLYEKKIATLEEREIKSTMAKRYEERFQFVLLPAFVLLAIQLLLSRAGNA